MGYKPRQLGHINIYVRNAERARDWYEDLLGLHTYGFRPGRAAFMHDRRPRQLPRDRTGGSG